MRSKQKNIKQHMVLVVTIILISIFTGALRDVTKYYKNMVYVSFFNAVYYLLCRRHLVWEFIPNGIHWWVIRLVHILIITPLIALIFLSKMPSELYRKVIYLIKWVITASVIEYCAHKEKLILYAHGWNVLWSGLLYLMMFTNSFLFTKRPIITVVLSLFSTAFYVIKFKVPLKKKHYSKYFEPLVDFYYHTFFEKIFSNKRRKIV